MKAIVTGMIATYPMGGVAWDYCQYAAGFERLGLDVYYLEDTGVPSCAYNPATETFEEDAAYSAAFLAQSLAAFSPTLGRRWHYRSPDGATFGLSEAEFQDVAAEADVLINVSGGTLLRDSYRRCPKKVFIDTDPGWNHFVIFSRWDAKRRDERPLGFRSHDYFFTFAERMGEADCVLPDLGLRWLTTRHPVLPDLWEPRPPGERYTTLMMWNTYGKPVEYGGVRYGSKEVEFEKIEALPGRVPAPLEVAVNGDDAPRERWRSLGWSVVHGAITSRTTEAYRLYVAGSRGELSVAKNIYVATRFGWFSGRSADYLAAGRPVIVQDTGFPEHVPTGEGVLTFSDSDGAASALERIEADYRHHERRVREMAETYFDSGLVLGKLLSEIGL
jgi:hypothetical protein